MSSSNGRFCIGIQWWPAATAWYKLCKECRSFCSQSKSDAFTRISRYRTLCSWLFRWLWYWLAMARRGDDHEGATSSDHRSIWLLFSCTGFVSKEGQSHVVTPHRFTKAELEDQVNPGMRPSIDTIQKLFWAPGPEGSSQTTWWTCSRRARRQSWRSSSQDSCTPYFQRLGFWALLWAGAMDCRHVEARVTLEHFTACQVCASHVRHVLPLNNSLPVRYFPGMFRHVLFSSHSLPVRVLARLV